MPKINEKKYRCQKHRKEWEKESWASDWLSVSKRIPGKTNCSLCDKDFVAGNLELMGHAESSNHIRQSKSSAECSSMRPFLNKTKASTIKAELNTVALIARKNISFNVFDQTHEKESFLIRCCNWYKVAIRQMQKRVILPRPILKKSLRKYGWLGNLTVT